MDTDARGESRDARELVAGLLDPAAYPPGCGSQVTLIETHISWVLLLDKQVFKVRKPVNLGFVDFTDLDVRRKDCEAEVRLNAALGHDVYLGVVPIWRTADGGLHVAGDVDGAIVEWAVQMRRLSESDRADVRLNAGELGRSDVEAIAVRIAEFHAERQRASVDLRHGSPEAILHNIEENFSATREQLARYLSEAQAAELVEKQRAFVRNKRHLLEARVAGGKVCETHGDLRLEHIYLDVNGRIRVLDCVEFSERFRIADVAADIAFLGMDLMRFGHPELAEALLAAYVHRTQDFELYALIDFYTSYRAFVRGKIAALIAEDEGATLQTREQATREARRCFSLALAAERPDVVLPTLIAVGGGIATGKSTVSERLAAELGVAVVSSDRTRKEMLGVNPTQQVHVAPFSGAYDPKFTQLVYREVLRRAGFVLASGRSVVIDASFQTRMVRAQARDLARRHKAAFRFVECMASSDVCSRRLGERARGPSVSDGRVEILRDFEQRFEPVNDVPWQEYRPLDTSMDGVPPLDAVLESLPHWPVASRDHSRP